jgi:hypothetical protein
VKIKTEGTVRRFKKGRGNDSESEELKMRILNNKLKTHEFNENSNSLFQILVKITGIKKEN